MQWQGGVGGGTLSLAGLAARFMWKFLKEIQVNYLLNYFLWNLLIFRLRNLLLLLLLLLVLFVLPRTQLLTAMRWDRQQHKQQHKQQQQQQRQVSGIWCLSFAFASQLCESLPRNCYTIIPHLFLQLMFKGFTVTFFSAHTQIHTALIFAIINRVWPILEFALCKCLANCAYERYAE